MRSFLVILFLSVGVVNAQPNNQANTKLIAFKGATVIDGTGAIPIKGATILIQDNRISCVGKCKVPENARVIDAEGQYVIPGLVDTHVHYWQSGWLDTFPGFDVSDRYPLTEAMNTLKKHPERFHRSYLCSGVTAVLDPGGPPWLLDIQNKAKNRAPHYASAGPLLTTMKSLPNHPVLGNAFIYMEDEETVREAARQIVREDVAAIKVHRTDLLDDAKKQRALIEAAAEVAGNAGIQVVANVQSLSSAKTALRAGADLLIYPIEDTLVDQEFINLARKNDASYVPALGVSVGAQEARSRSFDENRLPLECVDPQTRKKALVTNTLPHSKDNVSAALPERKVSLQNRREENMRLLHEAGVNIAVGSGGGAPLTLHGPATIFEMQMMAEAGIKPMEVLVAGTQAGAKAIGRLEDFGTLQKNKIADLIVLELNPLEDISNLNSVQMVVRNGEIHMREELEYR